MLQKKLASFVRMFSKVKGMQQLYKHNLLYVIFVAFLSNPDIDISQMALSCLSNYKLAYLTPYKEQLQGMLGRLQFRETLTKFDLSHQGGTIDRDHRQHLIPLIIRILYGRLTARGIGSKSSRDSPAVRRAAILSFLSGLSQNDNEIDYFVYMMVRSFIPPPINMQLVDCGYHCQSHITAMIQQATPEDLLGNPIKRQEGFLNLMCDVIKKLGYGIANFITTFLNLTLSIIENVEQIRKENRNSLITGNFECSEQFVLKQSGKVRTLSLLRIAELMEKFASSYDFNSFQSRLWLSLQTGLVTLPSNILNAEKPPSLLVLLVAMSSHPHLINLLVGEENAVRAVFSCISVNSKAKIMESVLKFIDNLLTEGGTLDVTNSNDIALEERPGTSLVMDHLDLLIGQFTKRLESGGRSNTGGGNEVDRTKEQVSNNMLSKELSILCRISELLVVKGKTERVERQPQFVTMMESLCKLLLPFLDFSVNNKESSQADILGILICILPQIRKVTALSHLQSLSRLLGPNKTNSGITSLDTRQKIISCIEAIHKHEEDHVMKCLSKVSRALKDLAAPHPRHVNEYNFEKVLPILNGLGSTQSGEMTWVNYISGERENVSNGLEMDESLDCIKTLTPLIFYCLYLLYDQDGVTSRGASKALKVFITTVKVEADKQSKTAVRWLKLLESTLVPRLLTGLKTQNFSVRRSFILLLAEVSIQFKSKESPHFYGDLSTLVQHDDQNLDFFMNITHIQVHRRIRALNRLRKYLSNDNEQSPFFVQSISNVLVPLAMHPIYYDVEKSTEESYALEAIATIGALMKHLPWGKYQSILWKSLLDFPRFEKQERYFIAMICSIIDAFHFDVKTMITNDQNSDAILELKNETIQRQLNSRIIPKIESYLVKEKVDHRGKKGKGLRAPIVLALVKLFKKMPSDIFESKLARLLTIICNALADKDSNERELARNTMSKLAEFVGVEYLSDIIRELAISLSEGYKLHVRVATLHSVLLCLSQSYTQPTDQSLQLPFDKCLPAMMDIIQQDIFGDASEIKEVESVKKRLVKEAMGAKSYSCLEIMGRMILFKPSTHSNNGSLSLSSVHLLVHPFLQRLRDPEIDSKTLGKIKECLNRIALGISHNASTATEELLPFVYVTVFPFVSNATKSDEDDSDISDDEAGHGLEISKTKKSSEKWNESKSQKQKAKHVFEWAPSMLNKPKSSKSAYDMKVEQKADLKRVQDGVNAPKLTGSSRNEALKSNASGFNDPATSSAVSFTLTLLNSHLKKAKLGGKEMMVDPFVKILTHCIRYSKDTSAILLSLKCLQVILRLDLPSTAKYKHILASHTLRILSMSAQNTNDETVQCCFKTLTLLITKSRKEAIKYLEGGNDNLVEEKSSPDGTAAVVEKGKNTLNDKQMQILVSLLKAAITDTDQHNATFSVIKAITSTQYVSPDYYDLMEDMLRMTVQSQQQSVRQVCISIFPSYFSKLFIIILC